MIHSLRSGGLLSQLPCRTGIVGSFTSLHRRYESFFNWSAVAVLR